MRLIVDEITGGLGNQLFQYAFGRALVARFGGQLILDRSEYVLPPSHRLSSVVGPRARRYRLAACKVRGHQTRLPLARIAARLTRPSAARILRETRFYHYDPDVLAQASPPGPPVIVLRGFWQAVRYLQECRDVLRAEILPRHRYTNRMLERVDRRRTVAVHVRRGDYLNSIFRNCPFEYYRAALERMNAAVSRPTFLLFSDDRAWLDRAFRGTFGALLPDAITMDNRSDIDNFFDMLLYCGHFIIANSTFSWWPAYLASTPGSIVIAPDRWFENPEWDAELYPPGWIRLAS
jgi:hypothetical protein